MGQQLARGLPLSISTKLLEPFFEPNTVPRAMGKTALGRTAPAVESSADGVSHTHEKCGNARGPRERKEELGLPDFRTRREVGSKLDLGRWVEFG